MFACYSSAGIEPTEMEVVVITKAEQFVMVPLFTSHFLVSAFVVLCGVLCRVLCRVLCGVVTLCRSQRGFFLIRGPVRRNRVLDSSRSRF